MNHITLLKHLQEALLRVKNLIADLASNTLGAIEDIEISITKITPKNKSVTLASNGWIGTSAPYSQTVTVSGVISNESKQNVNLSPLPVKSNIDIVINCCIYCTAQGDNTLTFVAFDDKPSEDVTYNVSLQNI